MTYLLNTENGRVDTYESWCYAVYDDFITQEQFNRLVECNEHGDIL
jgi:hypothetical protein